MDGNCLQYLTGNICTDPVINKLYYTLGLSCKKIGSYNRGSVITGPILLFPSINFA